MLDRYPAVPRPSPKKRVTASPHFSAHVYSGQTAGQIKMPLGTEIGLGPGDIVLDGNPAPVKGAQRSPIFGPCLLYPNCWVDQDATWYEVGLGPGHIVLGGDPSPQIRVQLPNFRPMPVVAKRLDGLGWHVVRR